MTRNMNTHLKQQPFWTLSQRVFHWLAAGSMAGAVILTAHGDMAHSMLGWIALGVLLIGRLERCFSPAQTLITATLVGLNLSGWMFPHGPVHAGFSLAVLMLASFYQAAVLFELLRCLELSWSKRRTA